MKAKKVFQWMSAGAVVVGMVLGMSGTVRAQDTTQPPQQGGGYQQPMWRQAMSPERELQRLTKLLDLTPDQQKQMLPILQNQQKKRMAIWNNTSIGPDEQRRQMRQLGMDTRQKLEAIMTDGQQQQYEEYMQEQRSRRGGMGEPQEPGAGAPPSDGQGAPPPPPQA